MGGCLDLKRNEFKYYRCHWEDGDANYAAIEHEVPVLVERLKYFRTNDIFNADEFGVVFKLSPNSTVGPGRLIGRQKKKDRVTFLACSNSDGTERLPLLVIGTAKSLDVLQVGRFLAQLVSTVATLKHG